MVVLLESQNTLEKWRISETSRHSFAQLQKEALYFWVTNHQNIQDIPVSDKQRHIYTGTFYNPLVT